MLVWTLNIILFLVSCGLLYFAGELIVTGLLSLSRFFGLKEFVVAFFVMAVAASLPNLFVGITSATQGIPELSFGDIMGNNLISLTIAVSLAIMFSPKKEIPADSRTIQTTSIFTMIAAILPLILISDGILSRIDGLILIGLFILYVLWLFSKEEHFTKIYEKHEQTIIETKFAFIDVFKIVLGAIILFLAAQGIVTSASFMAIGFGLPLVLIGIFVLGFGSALPEVYFAISSARKEQTYLILGNLMGAVIIPATLILGLVVIIHPITSEGFEFFATSRFFLIISALFFFIFTKSNHKITQRESYILLAIYLTFVMTIIFLK